MGTEQRARSGTRFQCFELKHSSLSSGELQFTWSQHPSQSHIFQSFQFCVFDPEQGILASSCFLTAL